MNDAASALRAATMNAAAMWTVLSAARGHNVVRRDGFLAVTGPDTFGLRIMMLDDSPADDDLDEMWRLIRSAGSRIAIEDPFASGVDYGDIGLKSRHLPVMMRQPTAADADPISLVRAVEDEADLRIAEDVMVNGFPMERFQPHQPGVAFPAELLSCNGVKVFLAAEGAQPIGACLAAADEAVVGVYWVTTMPAFRSRGVGRGLMHAVQRHFPDAPITLSASTAGKPLYDKLGFATVALATWWS